jgi:hypothetical protein
MDQINANSFWKGLKQAKQKNTNLEAKNREILDQRIVVVDMDL